MSSTKKIPAIFRVLAGLVLLFGGTLFACSSGEKKQEEDQELLKKEQATLSSQTASLDTATFAGGCFWCTEAYFERVKGVKEVVSGYVGGTTPNPTYQEVSYGRTDYAEGVQVFYDPSQVSYATLVKVFFATMDPTQLNRQGPDVGEQYRSVVFPHTGRQKEIVSAYMQELEQSGQYSKPIVTTIEPFEKFYNAEKYHQDYYKLNPSDPYVRSVARPKVRKFEKEFKDILKKEFRS